VPPTPPRAARLVQVADHETIDVDAAPDVELVSVPPRRAPPPLDGAAERASIDDAWAAPPEEPAPLRSEPPPAEPAPPPIPLRPAPAEEPAPPPLPLRPAPAEEPAPPVDAEPEPEPPPAVAPSVRPPRQSERRPVHVEVGVFSDSNFYLGFTENISAGGLFIATYRALPIGSEVDIQLDLPTGSLTVTGVVRWLRTVDAGEGWPGMGVQFARLSADDEVRIREFVGIRDPLFFDE
jgi:uncharacterized protein (TIGR02266 family)